MELVSGHVRPGYYIRIPSRTADDHKIAKILNIPYRKYLNILKRNHASYQEDYFFQTKEDIKAAIKELEPYLIMITLTE